ncbi:unnamed protein product [Owenia fusiformis]|uniref:Uncharacterized protein n=1 Tax=Owenia fusiformis TaxID=6347 RepID=A0A8J1UJN8_OWEFU|nr:unnamed protein product [Owenia fusiformis]
MKLLLSVTLLAFVCLAHGQLREGTLQCYECNVYKGGYGVKCTEPMIRNKCHTCLKIETRIKLFYYWNNPSDSVVISRVCAGPEAPAKHACWTQTSNGGETRRCFCDTNLCNNSRGIHAGKYFATIVAIVTSLFAGLRFS